jgi:hypothetical protein
MMYEILGHYHTGLLLPEKRVSFACQSYASKYVIKKDDVIARLKAKWRARDLFGDKWVRNQGNRGSCNGYACAGSLSRIIYLSGLPEVHLSGEFVYANINGGLDRGSTLDDGMRFLMSHGACREEFVQHETYLLNRISEEAKQDAKNFIAHECLEAKTELELADGLSNGFIAVVAVHASQSYSRLDSNGIAGESNGVGNHSVSVDDCIWDGNRFVFDQPQTWGINWGDGGRCRLTWDRHLRKTVQYHQFFLIRGVSDRVDGLFSVA